MAPAPPGPVERLLDDVLASVRTIEGGAVADYIPELAKADPAACGLALATLDGTVYTAGDEVPFTIQSVSKPFVYALALADSGSEAVLARVGAEPTGDPFNTISLDDVSGRAFNPMVNAGAIVTATLVAGASREEQLQRIHDGLSAFAGRRLAIDEDVYASERETGDRNRAIAYLMRSAGLLDEDVDRQVEMYFRQCSIVVTARDLAVMAATLANAGVNPTTGEQVVPPEVVAPVLTVMSTCGMYDYAGEWLYRVGLPAKSGVSGGIAAALPGQLGLAAHSPRLDARGNSVRGVAACEQISARLGLHLLKPTERTRAGLRRSYRADAAPSKRTRRRAEEDVLGGQRSAIAVHELVGDLGFAGVEDLVRGILADPAAGPASAAGAGTGPSGGREGPGPEPARWRVLDLGRVTRVDQSARYLLAGLVEQQSAQGCEVVVVEPRAAEPRAAIRALLAGPGFADVDTALEWCETQVLRAHGVDAELDDGLVPLAQQDLLLGLDEATVAVIAAHTTTKVFTAGSIVFDEGDPADGLYLVGAGQVVAEVRIRGRRGWRRLASTAPGGSFGELALVDGRPRSTRIAAIEPTLCYVLSPDAFTALLEAAPLAHAHLSLAIARSISHRLRRSTAEVAALEEA